jgi:hypothetical protein
VRFAGDGTFADEDLQPQDAPRSPSAVTNRRSMPGRSRLTEEQGLVGKTMLGAFAREPEGGGIEEVRVPVTLQNRKLLLGPIEFAELPPIEWPDR